MRFEYEGYWGIKSICEIDVYGNLVVATELDDNPGTSITNAVENLANSVCETFGIDKEMLVWIEHYPERVGFPESYFVVHMKVINGRLMYPIWKVISKEEVGK